MWFFKAKNVIFLQLLSQGAKTIRYRATAKLLKAVIFCLKTIRNADYNFLYAEKNFCVLHCLLTKDVSAAFD